MTQNRCGYARCAAPLSPDGPSPYFCGENCMNAWTAAQNAARTTGPKRGMEPTFVAVDETANIPDEVWAADQPLPDLPAAAYPPDAVPLELAPVPRRPGWLTRILGARR